MRQRTTAINIRVTDGEKRKMETENINALKRAQKILTDRGYKDINYNIPSASCCASFKLISELGGKSAEPGHGLTGTTPLHKVSDEPEKTAYVYVSEISHNFRGQALCFGGGSYRRGHLENCMVGKSADTAEVSEPCPLHRIVQSDLPLLSGNLSYS